MKLVFMCVPSHVGLASNLAADTAAKAAQLMPVSNLTLPYSDYYPLIRTHVLNQRQSSWSLETQNKLHAMEPTVRYDIYGANMAVDFCLRYSSMLLFALTCLVCHQTSTVFEREKVHSDSAQL